MVWSRVIARTRQGSVAAKSASAPNIRLEVHFFACVVEKFARGGEFGIGLATRYQPEESKHSWHKNRLFVEHGMFFLVLRPPRARDARLTHLFTPPLCLRLRGSLGEC
jgi:hypothetical protein